jgi:hypothetical protein
VATRRFLPFLLAAVAALAFVAPASAKELARVAVCGLHDACTRITDPEQLRLVPVGGATSVAAPRPQPFYWMMLTIAHGEDSQNLGPLYYLPESNLLGANGAMPGLVWLPISDPRSAELMRKAVAGIERHPARGGWPRELKSTYRVVPDDEATAPEPSSSRIEAGSATAPNEGPRRSAVWLVGAILLAVTAAAAVTLRSAVAPSGRRPAPRGFRLRGPGTRPL